MSLQGSTSTPLKRALERTLRYFGQSKTWSIGLFGFYVLVTAILSFLTDVLRLDSLDPLWILASAAGWTPALIIGILYKFFVLNRDPGKRRPWLNLFVAGLAGSARNLTVGGLAFALNLDNSNIWVFRGLGGFSIGLGVFAIWAAGLGSRLEYISSLEQLALAQRRLIRTRDRIPEQLSEVNSLLEERTRESLLPQFDAIKRQVGETESIPNAVEHLRQALSQQIRPVMEKLAQEKPEPVAVRDFDDFRVVTTKLPEEYRLRNRIMVGWSSVMVWIGISLWLVFQSTPNGLIKSLLVLAPFTLTLYLLKLCVPRKTVFSRRAGISLTFIFAIIASSASGWTIFSQKFELGQYQILIGFVFLTGLIGPVFLLLLNSRIDQRLENERILNNYLDDIAKENARFAQRLWVFRKRWLLVLHGTVQSALTAAIVRLQSSEHEDSVARQLALQDIRRAEEAVMSQLSTPPNFEKELSELVRVWSGICEIKTTISERAKRVLYKQTDVAFCANEILKEAVSNAVRHGSATQVKVTIDREQDDLLTLSVWNNGSEPEEKDKSGIGSEMMNEVCVRWNLGGTRGDVTLLAELPVGLSN
jgi:signal transduction histidine kinase